MAIAASPYHVKVLEDDLKKWVGLFRAHRIKAWVLKPETALGESVTLEPEKRLNPSTLVLICRVYE